MKTRQGFVSNSSSSSFIVALPKNIQMKDVKGVLFGNEERFPHPYNDGESYSTQQVAETVASDMADQTPNDPEKIQEAFGGVFEGYDGLPGSTYYDNQIDYDDPDYDMKQDALDEAERLERESESNLTQEQRMDRLREKWRLESEEDDKRTEAIMKRFNSNNRGKDIYVFEYADENGDYGSALEHGGTFDNVPHIKISKH